MPFGSASPANEIQSPLISMMEAQARGTFPFLPNGELSPEILTLLRSGFAQDTVAPYLGDKPVWVAQHVPNKHVEIAKDPRFSVVATTPFSGPDTIHVRSPGFFDDKTLLHEVQHVNDMRNYPSFALQLANVLTLGGFLQRLEDRAYGIEDLLDKIRSSAKSN